jgi:ubiquinone/menaquinone biosynthesis C-methylase UbiE
MKDDYENIRRSFSQEWSIFDHAMDKTWGWTIEERKRIFLEDVGFRREQLTGKRLLDAGCGNGSLTAAVSAFGMNVVGLDLSDQLGTAERNKGRYGPESGEKVHYVQGNLVVPPFRNESFDLIYSSGVIHHTPNSERAFDSLARLTKRGGRLYVWVYSRRPLLVQAFFAAGRTLKAFMSLRSVMRVCRAIAPLYRLAAKLLDTLGIMQFRARTSREITLDLFDAFAPRYNHHHTEAEVRRWFEKRGFCHITPSGRQKHGFGMYGDRP